MKHTITENGFHVNAPNYVIGIQQNITDTTMLYINFMANALLESRISTNNNNVLVRMQRMIIGINKSNSTYLQTAGLIELAIQSVDDDPSMRVSVSINNHIQLKDGAIIPIIRTFDNTIDVYRVDAKAPIFVKRYDYMQFNTAGATAINDALNAVTHKNVKDSRESTEEEFMHFWFFNK
jgi:hypothetical protein